MTPLSRLRLRVADWLLMGTGWLPVSRAEYRELWQLAWDEHRAFQADVRRMSRNTPIVSEPGQYAGGRE